MYDFRDFFESFGDAPYFNYQGSKASIRQWVIQYMPTSGRWYVEVFGGRGNMFFLAKKSLDFKYWHINDLNSAPFFQGLLNVDVDKFPNKMSDKMFAKFKQNQEDPMSRVLEPGISYLGHYRGGWQQKYKPDSKWDKSAYSQRVLDAREHLQDVKMTNLSWDAMPYSKYTSKDFLYFDPPYLDTDNRYYSDIDHEAFLTTVTDLKARWMISHTYHPLYIAHLGKPHAIKERSARLKVGIKRGNTGKVLIECIWKGNY